ncbi:hypothetical protein BC941DRAFT_477052 [Chlamydoabsidia padenii]|nr:hypothetical protein BC941DRAFT_477052 [Chlamydoabsidia padenii]
MAMASDINRTNHQAHPPAYPFYISSLKLAKVGEDMILTKRNIPLEHFNGNWDDIVKRQDQKILLKLIQAMHICTRWKVRKSNLQFVRNATTSFQKLLYNEVADNHIQINCCTITIRYLGHVDYIMERLGPMPAYSCRSLERTIGHIKNKRLSPSLPGASLQRLVETESALNHMQTISNLTKNAGKIRPTVTFLGKHATNAIQTTYFRSMEMKGLHYRSLTYRSSSTKEASAGQATVLVSNGSNQSPKLPILLTLWEYSMIAPVTIYDHCFAHLNYDVQCFDFAEKSCVEAHGTIVTATIIMYAAQSIQSAPVYSWKKYTAAALFKDAAQRLI